MSWGPQLLYPKNEVCKIVVCCNFVEQLNIDKSWKLIRELRHTEFEGEQWAYWKVQDDYVAEYQVACLSEDGTSNIAKEFKLCKKESLQIMFTPQSQCFDV